jgi:hypothetical protein
LRALFTFQEKLMNFIERLATILDVNAICVSNDAYICIEAEVIRVGIADDHTVVWYKTDVGPRFVQIGEADYLSYVEAVTALLPIATHRGQTISTDLLAVLSSAPDEVLHAFAEWAESYNPERYPSTREVWGWLNKSFG